MSVLWKKNNMSTLFCICIYCMCLSYTQVWVYTQLKLSYEKILKIVLLLNYGILRILSHFLDLNLMARKHRSRFPSFLPNSVLPTGIHWHIPELGVVRVGWCQRPHLRFSMNLTPKCWSIPVLWLTGNHKGVLDVSLLSYYGS